VYAVCVTASNLNFQIVSEGCCGIGMCCLVRRVWRNFAAPAYCCRRQFSTLSDINVCFYNMPHMLSCQSARHLSKVHQRTTRNVVRSLLRSSSSSPISSTELACFWQRDGSSSTSSSLPFIAHQPVMLQTLRSLSSSVCHLRVKTAEHENNSHLSFHRLRHYMPRQLAPSRKTIVDASPLSLQPYLRLIRFDRPIGMARCYTRLLIIVLQIVS